MKRTLTSIAAASMALGTLVPVAFASTSSTSLSKASQLPIVVNGSVLSNPYEMTGKDSGNTTGFFPIYYFNSALSKIGFSATWNGTTHTWAITAPGVTPAAIDGGVGTGNTTVTVNGTTVKKFNTQVAKDPAGGPVTTYLPIYYINKVLTGLGVKGNFSGQTGLSLTGGAVAQTGTATLSTISTSGATTGDGSAANPSVSLNNTAVALSTTMTDANGNAVANTAVTFNVSNYGNYPSQLPSVANASGTVISGTKQSNAQQYTVYTDSTGVAKVSLTNPSGQTNSYEVVATAPYLNGTTMSAVSTQPSYVEFVSSNSAGIAPYGSLGTPFNGTIGAAVPVTVTLPPNAQGKAQANVLVTLTVTKAAGGTSNASFVNSNGAVLGQQIQVATNSAGVAQAYLSDSYGEEVQVAVSNLPSGVGAPSNSFFNFGQAGVASKISNLSVSTTTPTIGENVVVTGQLQDASGNPVANGQILVTSPNNLSTHFSYVSGTTTTVFPLVSSVSQYTPATSAYGDLVTADAAGNFSFTLTDSRTDANIQYNVYPVSNGQVSSGTAINTTDNQLTFGTSTTLAYLSVGAFAGYVTGNSDTSITGLSANIGEGNPWATNDLTAKPKEVSTVYVEPQNSAGHHTGGVLTNTSLSYNLSADNGGLIYSINGQALSSPVAAVSVSYDGSTHKFTVNGTDWGLNTAHGVTSFVNASDFSVGYVNGNAGATKLTIASGSVSSTATTDFTGSNPAMVGNFAPGSTTLNSGATQDVTLQVQDVNANPVTNSPINIYTDQSAQDPFFVTKVNGVAISESLNMGGATASYTPENTPIPLGSYDATKLNYSVSDQGVVTWTNGQNYFTVWSDASGNVKFTVQAGSVTYPTYYDGTHTANPNNLSGAAAGSGFIGFYSDTKNGTKSTPLYVYTDPTTAAPQYQYSANAGAGTANSDAEFTTNAQLQGQIGW